jgi:hypothetical protein
MPLDRPKLCWARPVIRVAQRLCFYGVYILSLFGYCTVVSLPWKLNIVSSSQKRLVLKSPAPLHIVDCAGTWVAGACSCVTARRTLTYQITRSAANGGRACPNRDGDTRVDGCQGSAECGMPYVYCIGHRALVSLVVYSSNPPTPFTTFTLLLPRQMFGRSQ